MHPWHRSAASLCHGLLYPRPTRLLVTVLLNLGSLKRLYHGKWHTCYTRAIYIGFMALTMVSVIQCSVNMVSERGLTHSCFCDGAPIRHSDWLPDRFQSSRCRRKTTANSVVVCNCVQRLLLYLISLLSRMAPKLLPKENTNFIRERIIVRFVCYRQAKKIDYLGAKFKEKSKEKYVKDPSLKSSFAILLETIFEK